MLRTGEKDIVRPFFYWSATIFYMGMIFYFSSKSSISVPIDFWGVDKIAHLLFYIPLSFLFYISFSASGIKRHVFILSVLFSCLYGISDELHQIFVPGRIASIGDFMADSIGAFIGSFIANSLKR